MNPWTRMGASLLPRREAGPQHNSRGCVFLAPETVGTRGPLNISLYYPPKRTVASKAFKILGFKILGFKILGFKILGFKDVKY